VHLQLIILVCKTTFNLLFCNKFCYCPLQYVTIKQRYLLSYSNAGSQLKVVKHDVDGSALYNSYDLQSMLFFVCHHCYDKTHWYYHYHCVSLSNNPYLVRLTDTWVVDAWLSIKTQIHEVGDWTATSDCDVSSRLFTLHYCTVATSDTAACMRGSRRRAVPVDIPHIYYIKRLSPYRYLHDRWPRWSLDGICTIYVNKYTVACNARNSVAYNTTRRRLFCFPVLKFFAWQQHSEGIDTIHRRNLTAHVGRLVIIII